MSIKGDILTYFETHRGIDVSGQELAATLGVSRNAVWKAVEALRADGYAIDSGTNRGYRFAIENDILSPEGIRCALGTQLPDVEIIVYDTIDSTNNEAKRMLSSGYAGEALLVANSQTAGRGRRGRSFESPAGGLYMTLILQEGAIAGEPTNVTMAAAVAVAHALSDLCQVEPAVKWVNDVLVDGLKVCGILSEGTSDLETGGMQNVAVGIGVNLGTAAFSKELDGIAGAVALANGHTRNEFAAHVACELKRLVADDASIAKMTAEYKRLLIAPAPEGAFSA